MEARQAPDDTPGDGVPDGSVLEERVVLGRQVSPILEIGENPNRAVGEDHGYSPRKTYSIDEDEAILRAIVINNWYERLSGNQVYKEMEDSRVVRRSWQSIKNRVKRHILPNLDFYELPRHAVRQFRRL